MLGQSRQWRGALVGFGFIAERAHLPVLFQHHSGIELKAVVDPCEARRRKAKVLRPNISVFPDIDALFSSALAQEIDFIDCCTPTALHSKIALESLQRGYHVLSESVLSLDRRSSDSLRQAARLSDAILFPVHRYRFAPVLQEVQKLMNAGEIGPLKRVHLELHAPTHAKGVSDWDPHWRRLHSFAGGG